jgi:hypothetical protein
MADWVKIKTEYVTDATMSYRKLVEKYGVSMSALRKRAKSEGWVKLRARKERKRDTQIVNSCATDEARKALKILGAADKAVDTILRLLSNTDSLSAAEIKSLTSALRDLAAVLGIRTEADIREQEARIAKLQHEAERYDAEHSRIEIIIPEELRRFTL